MLMDSIFAKGQTKSFTMFKKRKGTAGICGQLYESKLISLLYFRAIYDDRITEFQLASNIDNIGAFDDICFKIEAEGLDRPVLVFIQAKHKENEKQTLTIDLATYFSSYLKIRHNIFESSDNGSLFNGASDKTECLFIIYTTARNEFSNESKLKSKYSLILNDLIDTGGTAKQPDRHEQNVEILSKIAVEHQISLLAERIAKLIMEKENFQMLSDELILRYHVILAQKVFDVSEIKADGQRIAFFRNDFFDTNDEYLILFKNVLCKEILKRRKIKPGDVKNLLTLFLDEPTDASRLSKLIVTVVMYNNGQLELTKKYTKDFNHQVLHQVSVSRFTVNQAIELAAKEILSIQEFKVPAAFGNKDITIRGSDEKIEKRMNHLALKIKDLLDKCSPSYMVTVDDSLEKGLLQLNGGLAGAIGNIFVLDNNTKWMKVTDNCESLEGIAKKLYKKLTDVIHDLHKYKFRFNIHKFPKLSFDCNNYEENLAKDFLNKLLIYSEQANEKDVENILKSEIEEYQRDHVNCFQAKTDAIFSKYHDDIQKWWMQSNEAVYLTKHDNRFETAIHNIVKDPLMSLIKVTYMSKIKHYKYTFTEDAVNSLRLQAQQSTVILTENSIATVVKVIQYLKNKEYNVLDLEYIVDLPTNDRIALLRELKNTNEDNVLIIVCDKVQNSGIIKKIFGNIAEAVQNKKIIVITNKMSLAVLEKYFPNADNIVRDEKSSLIDMSEDSQKKILNSVKILFQGEKVKLSSIVDDKTVAYVIGDVLNNIIIKDEIVLNELILNKKFKEIKHLYVDRSVTRLGNVREVRTLFDIADDVVLITADPGMGKSTLLSQLSLKTKEICPDVWIVRINLLEYSKDFSKWKNDGTTIDILESLKFMCQIILRGKQSKENKVEIVLEELNDVVYLKYCTGDQWTVFELNLFLNFYHEGKVIFLFDGFDEICPHYTEEVMKLIKTIRNNPQKQRIWITSRSYKEVKTILQNEFGPPYEINNLSYMEIRQFLEIFWKSNLKLDAFNRVQLDNVKNFIEYVCKLKDFKPSLFVTPLHRVYLNAVHYLINEIKYTYIPLWTHNKNYNDDVQIIDIVRYKSDVINDSIDGNPFHLTLAAAFVEDQLKSLTRSTWNLELNSFAFYEQFLETKMKTIRFQEKNEMNIYYPDIIYTYDKELADFILKHKKLAAYAIFCDWPWKNTKHGVLNRKLLLSIDDLKEMIPFIHNGGGKTGLISSSEVNRYPILIHTTFVHRTFTDYLAVEYVCDCLKHLNRYERQRWMDFIFNVIFSPKIQCSHVHVILDHKLKIDETLMSILESNKNEIFDLIMEQGRLYAEYIEDVKFYCPGPYRHWALVYSVYEQLPNFMLFFVKILECYINKNNLNDFLEIVNRSHLLVLANKYKSNALLMFVFDKVREVDKAKFYSVLSSNFSYLSHSTISKFVEMSSQEIVNQIAVDEAYEEPPWSERLL
ncbi:hypothetical protein PYW07_005015 [Mythimna separata]|uniref:NACHT domain-containing protein n=1 Tax=Mythimna separata TaxID=271217 RepID=A0AAD7YEX9_MYTSE|nr:hypothetical protein PYW07_005015 [Mythimna separata]